MNEKAPASTAGDIERIAAYRRGVNRELLTRNGPTPSLPVDIVLTIQYGSIYSFLLFYTRGKCATVQRSRGFQIG